MPHSLKDELYELVCSIPPGCVTSYGALGRALPNRVPAIMVGRWMAQAPQNVPWWRVIGADGHLPLAKSNPDQALIQEKALQSEGVQVENHRVNLAQHFFDLFPPQF